MAGLAAARAARRAAPPDRLRVTLLEASGRLGGKVFTEVVDGIPWEWGPDALVATKPRGRDLLDELGLLDDAVAPATGRAYLLRRGELRPLPPTAMGVPTGPGSLARAVRAGILSPRGALRALAEPLTPRIRAGDREVEDAVRKRLGREVADRLVLPLVGGVFGDVASLDMAMPELSRGRSLMLAARRRPPVRFLGLRGGMGRLVEALAGGTPGVEIRLGTRVRALEDLCGRFTLRTPRGPLEADAVLLAVPAPTAHNLLSSLGLTGVALYRTGYSRAGVVHLRYPQGALGRPLDAAGWVSVGSRAGRVSACSWVSAKWPHLEEPGAHLRAVVPWPGLEPLGEAVADHVGRIMRASTPPEIVREHLWTHALPVYAPRHRLSVARARAALPPGVALAGASYDGVGIPDCVASGEAAARGLLGHLRVADPGRGG